MTTGPPLRHWTSLIFAACLISLSYDLSGYPLLDPDEGRNAEVAREMASGGDYALPRLNGLPYVDKPVLYFAVTAWVMKLLGPTVFAARLPPLLFTVATLAVVAWFGRRLFGRDGGRIATIATAATPFSIAYSRTVIFDSALTFFVVSAIVSLYVAIEHTKSRPQAAEWWSIGAWVAMALGVLTKGPIALALPLLVTLPFAAWRRGLSAVANPIALVLFVIIIGPWVFFMQREVPGFLAYVVGTETVGRLFTNDLQRNGPIWYFVLLLPAAALPWSVVALAGIRRLWRMRHAAGAVDPRIPFLIMWILIPLVFFSLAQSKRPQYVLPLIPAIGLLVAAAWTGLPRQLMGAKAGAGALVVCAGLLLAGLRWIPSLVSATPAIAATIPTTAILLAIGCGVSGGLAWWQRSRRDVLLAALSAPVLLIPFVSRTLMDAVGRERSAFQVAQAIEPHLTPATQVVGVEVYPLSLPFYVRQTIVLSTSDARELTSNYIVRHVDRLLDRAATLRPLDWWPDAMVSCNQRRVFVFRSADREARRFAEEQLTLLIDTGKYAAYGPCGISNLAKTVP